jgi:hypothetical protein
MTKNRILFLERLLSLFALAIRFEIRRYQLLSIRLDPKKKVKELELLEIEQNKLPSLRVLLDVNSKVMRDKILISIDRLRDVVFLKNIFARISRSSIHELLVTKMKVALVSFNGRLDFKPPPLEPHTIRNFLESGVDPIQEYTAALMMKRESERMVKVYPHLHILKRTTSQDLLAILLSEPQRECRRMSKVLSAPVDIPTGGE